MNHNWQCVGTASLLCSWLAAERRPTRPLCRKTNLPPDLLLLGLFRQVRLQDLFDGLPRFQFLTHQSGIGCTIPRGAEHATPARRSEAAAEAATGAATLKSAGHVLHAF